MVFLEGLVSFGYSRFQSYFGTHQFFLQFCFVLLFEMTLFFAESEKLSVTFNLSNALLKTYSTANLRSYLFITQFCCVLSQYFKIFLHVRVHVTLTPCRNRFIHLPGRGTSKIYFVSFFFNAYVPVLHKFKNIFNFLSHCMT